MHRLMDHLDELAGLDMHIARSSANPTGRQAVAADHPPRLRLGDLFRSIRAGRTAKPAAPDAGAKDSVSFRPAG